MKLKNLLQTKSIAFNIALIIYFFTVIGVAAQTANSPIFDAPWRGFDTGIIGNGFAPVSFAVGDLDGDADADALVGNSFFSSPGIAVLKNRGDGTFDLPVRSALPFGETIGEVALSDFDRDGDLDAFATIRGSNEELAKIAVWRNAGDGSFTVARVEFPTGQAPVGIWVADFTGDNFPDVVTANYGFLGSGNTVSLLRHNGQTGAAAAFLAPVNYAAGDAPLRLAAADLNGDNRLDLAVGHIQAANPAISVPISILLNGGSGNFAAPVNYDSAPGARLFTAAVAFSDLDNDGDADLIGGGLYPNGSIDNGAIIVRRNNGAGVFGNHEIYSFPNFVDRPQKLTTADITGDGFADVLAAAPTGRATDGWVLLKSNGAGGFLPAVRYEAAQQTLDIKATDADRDGDLDVLTVARSSAAITVHKNPGGGAFPVLTRYATGELNTALESGDIDRDGDQDIVVTSVDIVLTQRTVRVLKNNGDGTFAPAVVYSAAPRFYADAKLRDLNGDGNLDVLLASHPQSTPYDFAVMLGSANGTFAAPVITPVNTCAAGSIDAFDLDNDSDLDVVLTEEGGCAGGGGSRIFIARNNGGAQFTVTTVIQNSVIPSGIGGGDLNDDGKIDLVTSSQAIGVHLGNGNLTFQPETNSGTRPTRFKIADFNRDNRLDVGLIEFTGQSFGTDRIGISLGNGNGTFAPANTQTGSSVDETLRISGDIDAADVDRDGDLDLAVSNSASNDISIFLNNGNGSLQPHQRYGVGYAPLHSAAADFNGDGKTDLASSIALPPGGLQNAVVVLRNIRAQIPTPTPTPFGIEADVAVRPNGDGSILSDDVVQIRRFLNATNTPDPMTNEFQRADSFPFADRGDGVLNSADVVQTRRYQNGTSALQMAGGPTAPNRAEALTEEFNKTEDESKSIKGNPREMRVESTTTSAGQSVTVNILVDAAGDEAEYAFILNYEESVLSNPVIGKGTTGASVRSCNTTTKPGQISCSVGGFAANNPNTTDAGIGEIRAGSNQVLISVTFTVAADAAGDTPLTLSDVNAASDSPHLFTPKATGGMVTIVARSAAARDSISDRVLQTRFHLTSGKHVPRRQYSRAVSSAIVQAAGLE